MKNNDMNNKPVGILAIAILFIAVGVLAGVCYFNGTLTETWAILVAVLLLVVGIIFVVFGTYRAIVLSKVKKLLNDTSAYETSAKFIKSKTSGFSSASVGACGVNVPISANVYKKVIYEYIGELGVPHVVKSVYSYFPAQVKKLESMGSFKIKCKGKTSVITEKLEDPKSTFNLS